MDTQLFWHFARVDEHGTPRLGYDDNRVVKAGETLRVEGEPELCRHGLHASAKLWHALGYAQGDKLALCRVTLGGTVKHASDKSVANERTVVAMLDAETTEKLLRKWVCWCALQVIHLWDAPDVVRQYLETGDESLRDAAGYAADAAQDAARDAARDATARAAAWYAADAAQDAARDAARDATARAAAWYAAQDAAWAAAWDAAGGEAEDAAMEKYAAELERLALAAMGIA